MTRSLHRGALSRVAARRLDGKDDTARDEDIVVECPVALLYNGSPFAVMMATPVDLEDFALGFALGEGVVRAAEEFRLADVVRGEDGVALHAAIPQARFDALGERRRNLDGRSGCGLCGVESLQAAIRPVPRVASVVRVSKSTVEASLHALSSRQPLNAASGGVHAAAFAHAGSLLVREDVGRHNALDKVVGARVREGLANVEGHLVVTSRASYEMVHKAATAGIGILVAISAPTDLAIRIADAAGITLVAFARGNSMNIYTHPERIVTR